MRVVVAGDHDADFRFVSAQHAAAAFALVGRQVRHRPRNNGRGSRDPGRFFRKFRAWRKAVVRGTAATQEPEPGVAGKGVAGALAEEGEAVAAEKPDERDGGGGRKFHGGEEGRIGSEKGVALRVAGGEADAGNARAGQAMDGNEPRGRGGEDVSDDLLEFPEIGTSAVRGGLALAGGESVRHGREMQETEKRDGTRPDFRKGPEDDAIAGPVGQFQDDVLHLFADRREQVVSVALVAEPDDGNGSVGNSAGKEFGERKERQGRKLPEDGTDVSGGPVPDDAALLQPNRARAKFLDVAEAVGDEEDGGAVGDDFGDAGAAFGLERGVADGEDFVEDQDLGGRRGRD